MKYQAQYFYKGSWRAYVTVDSMFSAGYHATDLARFNTGVNVRVVPVANTVYVAR